jgi:hypothetical protein
MLFSFEGFDVIAVHATVNTRIGNIKSAFILNSKLLENITPQTRAHEVRPSAAEVLCFVIRFFLLTTHG